MNRVNDERAHQVLLRNPAAAQKYFIILFVLILIYLTSVPLLRIGFTDHDSMYTALRFQTEDHYFAWVKSLAESQGRWQVYISSTLQAIPFLIDEFWFYKLVSLLSLFASFATFILVMKRLADSQAFGLLLAIVFLIGMQLTTDHSLLTGYFITYHLFICLLLFSLLFFDNYLKHARFTSLVLSGVLYGACCLIRELAVPYLLLYYVLVWARARPESASAFFRNSLKATTPHLIAVIVFLGSYFAFRVAFPSEYVGNTINLQAFSPLDALRAAFQLSVSAFPLYVFFDAEYAGLFDFYSTLNQGHRGSPWNALLHARPEWLIRAVIAAWLVFHVMMQIAESSKLRQWLELACVAAVFIVLPNVLIALTPGYQTAVREGRSISLHYTYFSFFGVALLFASILFSVRAAVPSTRTTMRLFLAGVTALCVFVVSLGTDYSNFYIARSLTMMGQKWHLMDEFLDTELYHELPDNSVIYAPSLWDSPYWAYYTIQNFSGSHLVPEPEDSRSYWDKYAWFRGGKNVHFIDDRGEVLERLQHEETAGPVYSLRYLQEASRPNQYLVFGGIVDSADYGTHLYGDEVTVFSLSENRAYALSMAFQRRVPAVLVDGKRKIDIDGTHASIVVNKLHLAGPLIETKLEASGIELGSVLLSGYGLGDPSIQQRSIPIYMTGQEIEAEDTLTSLEVRPKNSEPGYISGRSAHFYVEIPRTGFYQIELRARRFRRSQASVFTRLDAEEFSRWSFPVAEDWDWIVSPSAWSLTAGKHLIELRPRATYRYHLDRIRVNSTTIDPSLPSKAAISRATLANEVLSVSGWAIASEPIIRVEIHAGDQSLGEARYGLSRPDVVKGHPEYRNANSGFTYRTDSYFGPSVDIRVRVYGEKGRLAEARTSLKVE